MPVTHARTEEKKLTLRRILGFGFYTPGVAGAPATKESLGDTTEFKFNLNVEDKMVESEQSLIDVANFVVKNSAEFTTALLDGSMEKIALVAGVPASKITSSATLKRLSVGENDMGSLPARAMYVDTLGVEGPRTLVFYAVHLRPDGEFNLSKAETFKVGLKGKVVRPESGPSWEILEDVEAE